jgi:hypothetical protein
VPYASQPPRGVCEDCRRGVRADRLEGGRCYACRARRAVAGLPPVEAERVRRQLEAEHYAREVQLQARSWRKRCPRCGAAHGESWRSPSRTHPLCVGCQVQLVVRDLADRQAEADARRAAAEQRQADERQAPAPEPRRSLRERVSARLWAP